VTFSEGFSKIAGGWVHYCEKCKITTTSTAPLEAEKMVRFWHCGQVREKTFTARELNRLGEIAKARHVPFV